MKRMLVVMIVLLGVREALAAGSPVRPVHTYSIVAYDQETGQMGVAVQSHWFSVGSLVIWGEAGVGVVATQSLVEMSYGPLGLQLMKAGKTADQALDALLAVDEYADVRQVAMVDADGNVAAHTGEKCIPAAGMVVGDGFSVQANMMLNDTIWPAMAAAYRSAKGPLADRLLAALEAAQAAGGDIRGKQAAAILVVDAVGTGLSWQGRLVDLRVEDHPEPLKELRRLLTLQKAYDHMNAGDAYMTEGSIDQALAEYREAEKLVPDNLEMQYWHAVTLAGAGRVDESLPIFKKVFEKDPNWIELTKRLPGVDLLPGEPAVLGRILGVIQQ